MKYSAIFIWPEKFSSTKSDNLQYNTLVRWVDGTNSSSTKRLTFQVFFFIISYRLKALKTLFFFHFCNFIKKIKNQLKGFLQRILQYFMKNINTWNISRLVHELFVPSAQQTNVLYCRLTDFSF